MYFVAAGLSAFALSYVGVAVIRRLALRRGLLDVPNERSSHIVPTPRGGGVAIAAIVLIGLGVTSVALRDLQVNVFWGYLLGAAIVVGISSADDVLKLPARLRLIVHLIAAVVFVTLAGWIGSIAVPGFGSIELGWLGLPITLIWIVGLVNIYNFMDGIDGLAAGQAIIAGAYWLVILLKGNPGSLAAVVSFLIGASLGFLLHNLPPARIFMGDVGSTLLGFTFATLPILAYRQTADSHFFGYGVLCIAPFAFDGALTIIRRLLNHENVLEAHRSHLYQRLVKIGYSHGRVSLIYGGLALISGVVALAYLNVDDRSATLLVLLEAVVLVGYAVWVTMQEKVHTRSSA